jgi:hypothetical protein
LQLRRGDWSSVRHQHRCGCKLLSAAPQRGSRWHVQRLSTATTNNYQWRGAVSAGALLATVR